MEYALESSTVYLLVGGRRRFEFHTIISYLEPERGIEPPTFALQKHCSTVELLRHYMYKTGDIVEHYLPVGKW